MLASSTRFGSLDRRQRHALNCSTESEVVKAAPKVYSESSSRSMDELDLSAPLAVDVIDGSSIGPRFGSRNARQVSSTATSSSNESDMTLLPNQTYPDYPDFGAAYSEMNAGHDRSVSRMETVFDVDSGVYTRHCANISVSSIHSFKKKEKDWYETSLDSPAMMRKSKTLPDKMSHSSAATPPMTPTPINKHAAAAAAAAVNTAAVTPVSTGVVAASMANGTSTVRAQPVLVADVVESTDFEFDSVVPYESPKNMEIISPGKWEPYREVSKPFETSDIYKYSAKYRHQQQQQQLQQQTKGIYQPLQPMACQPLHAARLNSVDAAGGELKNSIHSTASDFRSKPATLV